MKKIYSLLFVFAVSLTKVFAQSFSDNFDTYTAGSYLAKTNSSWKTWSGTTGGTDDIKFRVPRQKVAQIPFIF